MTRGSRWRIRWTLLVAVWVLSFIPTIRSQQGTTQGAPPVGQIPSVIQVPKPIQAPPTEIQVTTERGLVRTAGRGGRPPLRLADMTMPIPADNPMTDAKAALGRKLFFEKRLSADGSVSCATCHEPARAFADNRTLAVGVRGRVGKRHSPALINRGFGRAHFWDGRADTLEAQVLLPISDPNEMDLPIDEALKRLGDDKSYRTAFETVFARPLSADDLARALATYVRSIRSGESPYDRFVAGDTSALTEEQQRGREVFTRSACGMCHREPLFTDERFWNTGVAWNPETGYSDDGRYDVSKVERDRGSFKTPTLREVARTAPYMHDGSLATLADVVEFYDKGARPNTSRSRVGNEILPPRIFFVRAMNLSADDKQALVRFLESLSGNITAK